MARRLIVNLRPLHVEYKDLCDYKSLVINTFMVFAKFRASLLHQVDDLNRNLSLNASTQKRLIGCKSEFSQLKQPVMRNQQDLPDPNIFKLEKGIYNAAQRSHPPMSSTRPSFTETTLKSDIVKINLTMIEKLTKRAKGQDLKQAEVMNATTVAILGSLNNKKVCKGVISDIVKARFFYQESEQTKSLATPFCDLVLFSTSGANTKDILAVAGNQVHQSLVTHEEDGNKLFNWIALRMSMEYDVTNGFRFGSPSFQEAERLLKKGIVEFIEDSNTRFSQFYEEDLPATIYVSHLSRLAELMAKKTGASAPWLVRELIARIISYGCDIETVGKGNNAKYGRLEKVLLESCRPDVQMQNSNSSTSNRKKLRFDRKVSLEGVVCKICRNGDVYLQGNNGKDARLYSQSCRNAGDSPTALRFLEGCEYAYFNSIRPAIPAIDELVEERSRMPAFHLHF